MTQKQIINGLNRQLAEANARAFRAEEELRLLKSNEPELRRLAYGNQAVRTAFNYIVQPMESHGTQRSAIIGNTIYGIDMSFTGSRVWPHTLVLCDCVIRPRMVVGSKHCTGHGAAGLLTAHDGLASLDPWLRHGEVLIDNR